MVLGQDVLPAPAAAVKLVVLEPGLLALSTSSGNPLFKPIELGVTDELRYIETCM